MSISVFMALQFNCSLRYLQSMNVFLPSSVITLCTSIVHPIWCYLLVNNFNLGILGAGLSMGITQFLNLVIVSLYIKFKNPYPESWVLYSNDTFKPEFIYRYLRKGIPAAVMFAADYLGFEILTFMSSFLGQVPMAANVCLFNYITLIFMIQIGISMAASTLVGNSIGAGNKKLSLAYAYCSILIGLALMTVTTLLTIYFRASIPGLYTQDKGVGTLLYQLIGIYIIFALPDSMEVVLHGIIKGLGQQKWASICCLIILYPINITLAYILAFVLKLGVLGLWYSQMMAVFMMCGSYFYLYYHVDLDLVIQEVKDFHEKERKEIEVFLDLEEKQSLKN